MSNQKTAYFRFLKLTPCYSACKNLTAMYKKTWNDCYASVCCINFINKSGIKSVTATGFKVGPYIISDDYSYKTHEFSEVEIFFTGVDGQTPTSRIVLPFQAFRDSILNASFEEPTGFSVIRGDYKEFASVPSLSLCNSAKYEIGQQTVMLGFQFEHQNLSIKSGLISAIFHESGRKYIEVDSTLRYGFSGAPLINIESGKVIGILGHRLELLNKAYVNLMKIINDNLKMLKEGEGKINIQDIDPIQVLIASQNQIKHMAKEFYKSADFRTGYALTINNVLRYFSEMALDMNISMKEISGPCK